MQKYNIILYNYICFHEIFTLALDLKINQSELDMNDVNDLNINNYYFNEFILWNDFKLNENNKDIILNNDEYSDEYRFGAHLDL